MAGADGPSRPSKGPEVFMQRAVELPLSSADWAEIVMERTAREAVV